MSICQEIKLTKCQTRKWGPKRCVFAAETQITMKQQSSGDSNARSIDRSC